MAQQTGLALMVALMVCAVAACVHNCRLRRPCPHRQISQHYMKLRCGRGSQLTSRIAEMGSLSCCQKQPLGEAGLTSSVRSGAHGQARAWMLATEDKGHGRLISNP